MAPDTQTLLTALSNALWEERGSLELLLFRMVAQQAVLRRGDDRWLVAATREVEDALDRLQVAELAREVEVAALGADLGAGDGSTLQELAALVDQPWADILAGHREGLRRLLGEVEEVAAANRTTAARALVADRRAADAARGAPAAMRAAGHPGGAALGAAGPAADLQGELRGVTIAGSMAVAVGIAHPRLAAFVA
ncbi:MAG TPA: flagellar export chaperone FlgN [Acidimicrobiales bacterium]|nr:flagellar export chaperone FlgN [Acidimicrobiales bacterium]